MQSPPVPTQPSSLRPRPPRSLGSSAKSTPKRPSKHDALPAVYPTCPPMPPNHPVHQPERIDRTVQKLTKNFLTPFLYSKPTGSIPPEVSGEATPLCEECYTRLAKLPLFQCAQLNPMMPQNEFDGFVGQMLAVLSSAFRIRRVELLSGVVIYEDICNTHWNHQYFNLIRNNLHATLLVCVMLSHKFSCDTPIRNECFASSFGVPLFLLNELELGVLELRRFNINVSRNQYLEIATRLQVTP
ncbi:hypothetical protein BLNAU_15145 [Blattamonas nauphoetae]|uniref:Uncharacterized protein n=1 Tax=Blattamonas nauphoetae TaxID=2049346 RepID=A0ABQ9XI10_9EUKA|nr:hypothetical protein BLNAU_15145 [Blattamonas nauphoetae]